MAGVGLMGVGGLWWRTGFPADAVDAAALCVAGVALGDIHLRFAWQAWHWVTGVALGDIHVRFTWQAWHLRHWAGLWWRTGFSADAVDAAALCVAGVALGDIHLHFAWQAWH